MLQKTLLAFLACSSIATAHKRAAPIKTVLTNDDGWAEANIRAQNDALRAAGYNVVLSAPAVDKSGTGSSTATPVPLATPCEFDTCPAGSPATGFNASDPRINYVNAFPADAARFGIQTLSPKFFSGPPQFTVSGFNVGSNLGPTVQISGTVGAACEAAKEGIPSTAFSAPSLSGQISYTTLANASAPSTIAARLYSALTIKYLSHLPSPLPSPILPPNITVNVNYPATNATHCASVADFQFVLTRILPAAAGAPPDVETCGTDRLTDETTVFNDPAGCFVPVSVFNATTKADVDAATQKVVLDRLKGLLSCLPS